MDNTADTLSHMEFLLSMAKKYIWWKTPEEALIYPQSILAQIMNIGVWDDLCLLVCLFSSEELTEVLKNAEVGQFNPRSWYFWSYRLIGHVPIMPQRVFE